MPDLHDEFAADGLVLGGGGLQRVGDDGAGEQIVGEVDLHSCGGSVVIAVGGKVLRVGLRHHLSAGILDDDAPDRGGLQRLGGWLEALRHEIAEDAHEKGGGADVDSLVERLAEHRGGDPVLEIAADLVERGHPGGDGAQQRLKESTRAELRRFADDQAGLGCDKIEVRHARP